METIKEEKKAELEKEIETLKDNIEFLHSCLDDRDKSIAILQEENLRLSNELNQYKTREISRSWWNGWEYH